MTDTLSDGQFPLILPTVRNEEQVCISTVEVEALKMWRTSLSLGDFRTARSGKKLSKSRRLTSQSRPCMPCHGALSQSAATTTRGPGSRAPTHIPRNRATSTVASRFHEQHHRLRVLVLATKTRSSRLRASDFPKRSGHAIATASYAYTEHQYGDIEYLSADRNELLNWILIEWVALYIILWLIAVIVSSLPGETRPRSFR